MSLIFEMLSSFCKRNFKIDQKFSIGLRSGEFPGQSATFITASLKTFFTCLHVWHGARSYWNTPPRSGKALRMLRVTVRLIDLV